MPCDTQWTTVDGQTPYLHEMSDGHLLNAYRMVGRILTGFLMGPAPQGEMAADAYEHELARAERVEDELAHEIRRRGLREWRRAKDGQWERRKMLA